MQSGLCNRMTCPPLVGVTSNIILRLHKQTQKGPVKYTVSEMYFTHNNPESFVLLVSLELYEKFHIIRHTNLTFSYCQAAGQ